MVAHLPQSSKATCRVTFGVVVSMSSTLGSPFGTGNGPVGSFIFFGCPLTITVTRGNGYASFVLESHGWVKMPQGSGKSKLCRDVLASGAIPEGETDAEVPGSCDSRR